ncbi:MAG: response regulator [Candidatus Latescibacterota bacterium]|nr:response regulator [Candidatus Latescibacterota bacterium]
MVRAPFFEVTHFEERGQLFLFGEVGLLHPCYYRQVPDFLYSIPVDLRGRLNSETIYWSLLGAHPSLPDAILLNGTISMVQIILAVDSVAAMRLGGVLLDNEDLNVHVVTDGRNLLDRLNEAPNFYHAVVMDYNLHEISGSECLGFIKQFHDRVFVLVLSDSLVADRLEELGRLGVRKKHVLVRDSDPKAFAAWVAFSVEEAGLA